MDITEQTNNEITNDTSPKQINENQKNQTYSKTAESNIIKTLNLNTK